MRQKSVTIYTKSHCKLSKHLHLGERKPTRLPPRQDQHTFLFNVWCGLLGDNLVGPFSFHQDVMEDNTYTFFANESDGALGRYSTFR